MFEKKGSILWVMLKRRVHFCQWKEGFHSVSLFRFKNQFCESCFEKVQFFESSFWVIFMREVQLFESFFSKQSSILSIWKKKFSSILWVKKKKEVIFKEKGFNSVRHFGETRSFLWVMEKSGFNSLSQFEKIFASHWKKIQFFESCKKVAHMKERFNSLRHFEKIKGFNSLSQNEKKTSTLWVILKRGS